MSQPLQPDAITERRQQNQRRREARKRAVQALYQWDMTDEGPSVIARQFLETQPMDRADTGYFRELLSGVTAHHGELDAALTPALDRSLDQLDNIERSVLRLAAFELFHRLDIPYRVVINEAVELTKIFGAEQAHKYVNGVLDKVALQARAIECQAKQPPSAPPA